MGKSNRQSCLEKKDWICKDSDVWRSQRQLNKPRRLPDYNSQPTNQHFIHQIKYCCFFFLLLCFYSFFYLCLDCDFVLSRQSSPFAKGMLATWPVHFAQTFSSQKELQSQALNEPIGKCFFCFIHSASSSVIPTINMIKLIKY